jgi:hypothetical protein
VTTGSVDAFAARVRAEYREMPGLSLTATQVSRLCGIHLTLCERVLQQLVLSGVLYRSSAGAYVAAPQIRDRT